MAALPSLQGQRLPLGQRGGFAQRLREGTYLGRVIEVGEAIRHGLAAQR